MTPAPTPEAWLWQHNANGSKTRVPAISVAEHERLIAETIKAERIKAAKERTEAVARERHFWNDALNYAERSYDSGEAVVRSIRRSMTDART